MRLAEDLRAVLGSRERPTRVTLNLLAVEEEAATRLYGERTGTVDAAPSSPPLAQGAGRPEREPGPPRG